MSGGSTTGLLRYQIFLVYGVVFYAIWHAALSNMESVLEASPLSSNVTTLLIWYAPVWAILALGFYAVVTIIHSVLTFDDCPQAAAEIDTQVREARAALVKRGIVVGS
mmetsp:Transcript_22461/g.27080  ORF Transcript_22461/g.27080 Transcript_22461/m.27080 type:complete len:108 (+) Transcript_22461:136-459(+)